MGKFFAIKMSSKKNKNKPKKSSEADGSLLSKDSSNDSSNPQTPGHEGGGCRNVNSNAFTITDFIDKGENHKYRCPKHRKGEGNCLFPTWRSQTVGPEKMLLNTLMLLPDAEVVALPPV